MSARAARLRPDAALIVLVAAGVLLRLLLMVEYRPAALSNLDSERFLHFAHHRGGLFDDHFGPSGYAAFLKLTRFVWDRFEATIALQHLFGVAAALLLYAAVRRLGAPRAAALVPAAVALLWGDLVYLEHAPLSESPFVLLVAAGLYCGVRGLDRDGRQLGWLAAAGVLVTAAALFRNVGLVLPPVVTLWALAATAGPLRRRLIGAAAVGLPAAAVIGAYAALAALDDGTTGMSDVSGWNIYGRAAPFADCTRFTPPKGTRFLCQSSRASDRPGSLFYLWFEGSPARARFGHPPIGSDTVGKWGRAAIVAQPLDYVRDVARQLPRFVDPGAYHRPYTGGGPFSIARRNAVAERRVEYQIDRDYDAARLHVGGAVKRVAEWQDTQRLGGVVPALLALLALLAPFLARGVARRGALLFALAGGALLLTPAATLTLISRYTVPPTPLVAAAAGVGAWAVVDRLRAARGRSG
jgi:hypothetical protein